MKRKMQPSLPRPTALWGALLMIGSGLVFAAPVATPLVLPPAAESVAVDGPAAHALRRAFDALQAGQNSEAQTALQEALRLDPRRPAVHIGLAELAARRGDGAGTERALRKAVEVAPQDATALRTLARYLARQRQPAEAEKWLRQGLGADPKSVSLRLELAEVLLRGQKNPKAAEAQFRQALTLAPNDAGAQLGLADSLAALRRDEEAHLAYQAAQQAAPDVPTPYLGHARFLASRTRVDEAIAVLDALLKRQPLAAQAQLDKGDLLVLKGDAARAAPAYAAAAAAGLGPLAHVRLAALHQARQAWGEAEQAYRAALKDDPGFVPALNNLAYLLAQRGERLDEALALTDEARQRAPKEAAILDTRAAVLKAKGDLVGAIQATQAAIQLAPKNPAYPYRLGILQAERGQTREAQAAFKAALALDPQFRDADDARQRLAKLGGPAAKS